MGAWHRGLLRLSAGAAALGMALLGPGLGGSRPVAAADAKVAFTLSDPRIRESSGLTRDPTRKLYWTVNDSGDSGAVYGVRPGGDLAGVLRFRANPIDVEAVVMEANRLYVADIGDNQARREFITVYFFDNPRLGQTVPYRSLDFAYPDGPHDAETLLVDRTGRLFVVTKERRGAIYAAPGQPSRQGVNRLIRVGDAPAYVTDGTFLPEGNRIALRTYLSVEVLDATSYDVAAQEPAPLQPQGESVAVTLDGKALLLGSEGRRSKVYRVPVPTERQSVPAAPSRPPGRATVSPSPSPSPTAEPDSESGTESPSEVPGEPGRQGTVLALVAAGFVALVAGVFVAGRRSYRPGPAPRRSTSQSTQRHS